MRNKLKLNRNLPKSSRKVRETPQTPCVIVLSDSSHSGEEAESQCSRRDAVKIAPIFLTHRKGRRGYDGAQSPPLSGDVVKKTAVLSHQRAGDRAALSSGGAKLSTSALQNFLQEIQKSSPEFPVQTVFSTLQKKAREELQENVPSESSSGCLQNDLKQKRKRGNETSERSLKRLRCSPTADAGMRLCHPSAHDVQESSAFTLKKQPSSDLSHRLKLQSGSPTDLMNNYSCVQDVLWTDKYRPQHSAEIIGNTASLTKVHSWLKKWKLRAASEERRKMEETKREENSNDSWDCGDFQGETGCDGEGEEPLCNAMLITGPSGVGKTASVYACAQELGFKVFEVNCSSQRSGRSILSQLKEATQSQLVEISGDAQLKPAYFQNYNSCTPKAEALPGKVVHPKSVPSASKKRMSRNVSSSGRKLKAKPNTLTLAHFFKMKDKADILHFGGMMPSNENPDRKEPVKSSPGCDRTEPRSKQTATSLILFEEVDVIFEDDIGFLAAIKAFMATAKRPVILTTNDSSFKERFDSNLEEIIFKTPLAVSVCSYLQLVCLAEGVWLDSEDTSELFRLAHDDVRRCLIQLQFWVRSGGGCTSQTGRLPKQPICSSDPQLPPGQTGCSASMLGLHPVTPSCLLNFLKCRSWSETKMNELTGLLAESWRGDVPLLYSNLELLLSLRAKESSEQHLDEETDSCLQSDPQHPNHDLHVQQKNQNVSQDLMTSGKPVKRVSRLSRRKFITTVSDSKPSSSFINGPKVNATTVQKSEKVVTNCLEGFADFFDLMSYLDATLTDVGRLGSGPCTSEPFTWTGSALKDGLLDEESEEDRGSGSYKKLLDIKAAAEGLGCHVLWRTVSEEWTRTQKYAKGVDSLFISSSGRHSLSLTLKPSIDPSVSKRQYDVSKTVLSCKAFSLLGNRRAVWVDYVPVLRSICRSLHARQQKGEPVRSVTYLSGSHLGLSKSTMKLLSEDFPSRKLWKPNKT